MKVLVLGAGGFIGGHMVAKLKAQGHKPHGVDIKRHSYMSSAQMGHFTVANLADPRTMMSLLRSHEYDAIYQFAADMGGAGYIFTGENDANVMANSASININVLNAMVEHKSKARIFYSSSACIYPQENQTDPENPNCAEGTAYPANPDSEYGWEKLFSERLYAAYARNHGIDFRIARYHNIYGPMGAYKDGREKAPAALCRKVLKHVRVGTSIAVWGDGEQTRSFLYIDDCITMTQHLMESDCSGVVNIGSEHMVSINELIDVIGRHAGLEKVPRVYKFDKPQGVRGRNSDQTVFKAVVSQHQPELLRIGIGNTYDWIAQEQSK